MTTAYLDLLEEALESWAYTRAGVIAELDVFPRERFEFRPSPRSRSVGELARHILDSGLMAVGELTRPDGDFTRKSYPEFIQEYGSHVGEVELKEDLIANLEQSHAAGDAQFRTVGELFMLQFIKRFDSQPGTRLAWFWHAIDHESYHRGQLAVYARLLGLVPALTRQIYGEQ
jgi:uncharacterized damage-inducible protein DinB